jgi:hypothetical protein
MAGRINSRTSGLESFGLRSSFQPCARCTRPDRTDPPEPIICNGRLRGRIRQRSCSTIRYAAGLKTSVFPVSPGTRGKLIRYLR